MKSELVPRIRFGEFRDEWDITTISKRSSKIGSGSTPKGGSAVYTEEGVQFIRSQNVADDQLTLDDVVYITDTVHQSMKGSQVKPNDILLNITGGSLGRSCVVPASFTEGNVNQHVCIVRQNKSNSSRFLQAWLSSYAGQKALLRNQAGSGREGLNFQGVRSVKLCSPPLPEQQKIAAFLTAVDGRLAGLRRQVAALERYKRGVMQGMFGGTMQLTSIFENKKIYKLKSIVRSVESGRSVNSVDQPVQNNNQVGILKTSSVLAGKFTAGENKTVVESEVKMVSCPVEANSIIVSRMNTPLLVGEVGFVEHSHENLFLPDRLWKIKCREDQFDVRYVAYLLSSRKVQQSITSIATGTSGSMKNISQSNFLQLELSLPSLPEQRRIATFLRALDARIGLVERQLAGTEAFKRGLLQGMFV